MEGIFNLPLAESTQSDDIFSMPLNETEEFTIKCPSVNPTMHFDQANSGNHAVPVPGGDKETPTAKPEGGEQGPAPPGGDKETPTAKPKDATSIPVPGKVTMTDEQQRKALQELQKSFKEGVNVLDAILGANVIHETTETRAMNQVEEAMNEAAIAALEDGPYFENSEDASKGDVKSITRVLRPKIATSIKNMGGEFYPPKQWAKIVLGSKDAKGASELQTLFTTRMWQILGICRTASTAMKKACDQMTSEFGGELNGNKIIPAKLSKALGDAFASHFGWKDTKNVYMILVDKKMPADLKSYQDQIDQALTNLNVPGAAK